jgi:HYDIN/CFA65/VesB family protein
MPNASTRLRSTEGMSLNALAICPGFLASSLALAAPGGALTTYPDLSSFLAATSSLGTPVHEDFEKGYAQYLPQTQFAACVEPVGADSNDACYAQGDLASGFHLASTNAHGVIVMNPDIYNLAGRSIGAWPYRLNAQSYTEVRFDAPPTAIAADVYGFAMGDGAVPTNTVPVQVDAYDANDTLIGTFEVTPAAITSSAFAGFTSAIPVARVVFGTHVDYSAGPIDDLYFAGGAGHLDVAAADVGPVVVGSSDTLAVTFANTGHLALSIGTLPQPPAPFSFESDACSGATLQPAATCAVQVRFAPQFEADFSQTLSVPGDTPTPWTLRGTGVFGGGR